MPPLRWKSERRMEATHTAIAPAIIVEVARTGLKVNDVPQYDIYHRVTPSRSPEFIGKFRTFVQPNMLSHLEVGRPMVVRYDPANPDDLLLADKVTVHYLPSHPQAYVVLWDEEEYRKSLF